MVPKRCEVYRKINIRDKSKQYIIISHEIIPGVFCANSILDNENPIIRLINTTNQVAKITNNFEKFLRPVEDYSIYHFKKPSEENRIEKLLAELNLSNMPNLEKVKLTQLCVKYNNLFALKTDKLTANNFYKQKINLNNPSPVYIKNYRTPQTQIDETNIQVNKMLEEGIIRPSVSPYNSPILLVPKKTTGNEKKWRLVVDFRQLNKNIVADKFPLPRIEEILDQLGRAKYFTTLDLMSGFHQIELEEESKKYTAFSSNSGHFEFNRLPFGLNISPNSFQRMMTIALSGLPPECAFLYIDDIIVVGCSINHHIQNLEKVFQKLQKYNLKLNPAKCRFFCADVTYLGHHISEQGIQPDKNKYDAILNYPKPQNADDVRRFVAFCNYYRRFIANFSEKAAPLNQLLKKNAKFEWTNQCDEVFIMLKNELLNPTILKFPNFHKTFILSTDASKIACGAVLEQEYDGIRFPIAYASRKFTKGESNKSTIEQELSAIHWAVNHFRPYLYGRKFTIRTDHNPLVYLFSLKNPASKLTRMRLDLEEFSFDIEHVKGKQNTSADALSRVIIDSENLKTMSALVVQTRSKNKQAETKTNNGTTPSEAIHLKAYDSITNTDAFNMTKLTFEPNTDHLNINIKTKNLKGTLAQAQLIQNKGKINTKQCIRILNDMAKDIKIKKIAISAKDAIFRVMTKEAFKKICNDNLNDTQVVIYEPAKIIKNIDEIEKILQENHCTPTGGHVGTSRLTEKIRRNYYWPNMKATISNYVKKCISCKQNKNTPKTVEKFQKTTTPSKPFELISIDTVGPLTKSQKQNRYALTIQCDLTKYVIAVAITDKQASSIAKAMVENLILVYGCPQIIKSDMGTEFKNEILEEICKMLKIEQKFATAYHPHTMGAIERNHRCLNEFLRQFINKQHDDWDSWLSFFTFCYNTTPHTDHKYSPFELVFGRQASLPSNIMNPNKAEPVYNHDAYFQELKFKLQQAALKTKEILEKVKDSRIATQADNINPININLNDKVWLRSENRKKLDAVFTGPFEVIELDHPNAKIKHCKTNEVQKVHKNRLIRNNS